MISLKQQLMTCVLDAVERAAYSTLLVPQAGQVSVKRLTKDKMQISLKMPRQKWQRFTLLLEERE